MIFFFLFCIVLSTQSIKLGLDSIFCILSLSTSLSALTLAPGCLHMVSSSSPSCSMVSDHACQHDECMKDSSDRTVSFDTHFHSSEPKLKYSSGHIFEV